MTRGRPKKAVKKEKAVQLNIHPPIGQPIQKTNQLVYLTRTIMNALIRHDESWPFLELITPQQIDIPNYYDIVTRPMSLRVVKKRLMNNYYLSAYEAIQDVCLVFENAYRVTAPDSAMAQMARNMETLFRAHLQAMPVPEMEIGPNDRPVRILRAHIPDIPRFTYNNSHDQCVTSSDAVKIEPMDSADDGNVESYGMMGFALRRLERFCGIERSQTDAIWTSPSAYAETVKFEDVCQSNVINSSTNNDNFEDTVIHMRAELDKLEMFFNDYTEHCEQSIEILREELDDNDATYVMLKEEKILVGATQDYSYTQNNGVTQIILHEED